MSLKITHKYSTAAGTPPASGDIDVGELAINAADAEIYTKDTAGNIHKFPNTTTATAAGVKFTQDATGAIQRTVEDKLNEFVSIEDFGRQELGTPFGSAGIKQLLGEKRDAHYGFGSVIEMPGTSKWVMIYRKATGHGTEDGTELRAADSYDFGDSWVNDRLIYSNPLSDSRPDSLSVMANGRVGFFLNRQDEGATHFSPLFFYTDNSGETFSSIEVTTSAPYTFSSVGGIIAYPASQGGHDTLGFISFGYLDAGGVDAFTTTDNGATWSIVSDVGVASGGITAISETVTVRLGNTDRWLIYARAQDSGGWHQQLSVFKTIDLLNWGAPVDAGVDNLGTPPCALYDSSSEQVYVVATARSGREIDGLTNHLLIVGEDADQLWSAGGVFSDSYSVLCAAPNWVTGYVYPFTTVAGTCAAFTAGENETDAGINPSAMWLIGDFQTKAKDVSKLIAAYVRDMKNLNSVEYTAIDNTITRACVTIENQSGTSYTEQGPYRFYQNGGGSQYVYSYNNGDVLHAYNGDVEFSPKSAYAFTPEGDVRFEGVDYWYGTISADIGGASSMLHLPVASASTAAIRSHTGSNSTRKHFVFYNGTFPGTEVGSISTTSSTTAYTTTSDESLKDFIGNYSGDQAIAIIKADPVRDFTWKSTGEYAVGWGAQTSYSVSPDLAEKGGWFLGDQEVSADTDGAKYQPWGVDQSKRTPYLWAAVSALVDKLEAAEARIAQLESALAE